MSLRLAISIPFGVGSASVRHPINIQWDVYTRLSRTASTRKLRAGRDCGTEIRGCLRGRHRLQKGVSKPQHPTTRGDCRPRSDVQTISPTQATPTSGGFCGSDGPLNGRSRGSGFVGGSSGGSGGVLAMGPTGESSLAGLNLTCMATSMCIGTFWALKGAYLLCPLLVRDPCKYSAGGNQKKHWFCWLEGMLRMSIGAVIFISWVFGRSALFRPPK